MFPICKLTKLFRPEVKCMPAYFEDKVLCVNKRCKVESKLNCRRIFLEYHRDKESLIVTLNSLAADRGLDKTAQEILEMCNCSKKLW